MQILQNVLPFLLISLINKNLQYPPLLPHMSSILQRSEVFTPKFSYGGWSRDMRWRPVILVLLPPGFCWICLSSCFFLQVWCVLLGHLSIGLFLVDCFCDIITCHYCFFCLYYFNVLHVFCAMRNSPNCDIFYRIIILKAIWLIL